MIKDRITQLIKPGILNARSYHVANADDLIKLNAMENPYGWPEDLQTAWSEKLKQSNINRYPDAAATELRSKLSNLFNLPDDVEILFGNGSDELIQLILLALRSDKNVIMAPEPTFVMYRLLSTMLELNFIGIPLNKDFSLDTDAFIAAIKQHHPTVIFLAWPNNPTGYACSASSIEKIINAASGLVVIDEAYHVFAEKTMMDCITRYPNVVLMRTLSKLGLAGLRLGMLFGRKEWITEYEKLRLPYNIGTLNQLSASFILDNIDVFKSQAGAIRHDRNSLLNALESLDAVTTWPSQANFILFRVFGIEANHVHQALIKEKILIRNLHDSHPLLENCLRVTVGTPEENNLFISKLTEILQN